MSDELYQDAIMTHARKPLHAGKLADADVRATVDNPLCGDRVTVELKLHDHTVDAVGHVVRGCALCQASASMLSEAAIGGSIEAVLAARDAVRAMLRDGASPPDGSWAPFAAFVPARSAPSRHECVLLPFTAFERAAADATKS